MSMKAELLNELNANRNQINSIQSNLTWSHVDATLSDINSLFIKAKMDLQVAVTIEYLRDITRLYLNKFTSINCNWLKAYDKQKENTYSTLIGYTVDGYYCKVSIGKYINSNKAYTRLEYDTKPLILS